MAIFVRKTIRKHKEGPDEKVIMSDMAMDTYFLGIHINRTHVLENVELYEGKKKEVGFRTK